MPADKQWITEVETAEGQHLQELCLRSVVHAVAAVKSRWKYHSSIIPVMFISQRGSMTASAKVKNSIHVSTGPSATNLSSCKTTCWACETGLSHHVFCVSLILVVRMLDLPSMERKIFHTSDSLTTLWIRVWWVGWPLTALYPFINERVYRYVPGSTVSREAPQCVVMYRDKLHNKTLLSCPS